MAEIRLKLSIAGGDTAVAGFDSAMRAIDSSVQYGAQRINSHLGTVSQQLAGIGASIGRLAGSNGAVVNAMSGWTGTITALGSAASGLYGSLKIIEQFGSSLATSIAVPLRTVGDELLATEEKARRFEIAIAGMSGGLAKARDLNLDLAKASRNTAETWEELRRSTQTEAFGSLAGAMATGSPASTAAEVSRFANLTSKLSLLNPTATEDQVNTALREFVNGGRARSLQNLVGYSPAASGMSQTQLASQPGKALQSVEEFANLFISDAQVSEFKGLLSRRLEAVRDALDEGLLRIGDKAYGTLSKTIDSLADRVFSEVESAGYSQRAESIARSLNTIVVNAGNGIAALAASIAGVDNNGDSVHLVTVLVDDFFSTIAKWSAELKPIGQDVGASLHAVAEALANLKNNSANAANRLAGYAVEGGVAAAAPVANAVGATGMAGAVNRMANTVAAWSVRAGLAIAAPVVGAFTNNGTGAANTSSTSPANAVLTAPSARAIIEPETQFAPWAAILQASRGSLNQFGKEDQKAESPLSKISDKASGLLNSNIGTAIDPLLISQLFQKIDGLTAADDARLGTAITDQSAVVAAHPGDKNLSGQLSYLQDMRTKMQAGATTAGNILQQEFEDAAVQYGAAVGTALKNVDPRAAAIIEERVQDGTTSIADQVFDLLAAAGRPVSDRAKQLGSAGGSLEGQLNNHAALLNSNLAVIGQRRQFGNIGLATTGAQILAMGPQSSYKTSADQLEYLQNSAMPQALSDLHTAQGALNGGPISESQLALIVKAQDAIAAIGAKMKELQTSGNQMTAMFAAWENSIQTSFTDRLGQAFDGLIMGSKTLGDVVKGLVSDIASSFAHLAAQNLVSSVLGLPANGTNPGSPGLFGSLGLGDALFGSPAVAASGKTAGSAGTPGLLGMAEGGAASLVKGASGLLSDAGSWIGGLLGFGDGGIIKGGWTPIHKFGDGGIVRGGQGGMLGLVGERSYDEMVIPLPNGSSLPLQSRGSSGGGSSEAPRFYIVNSPQEAVAQGLRQSSNQHYLVDLMSGNVKQGGKLGKTIRSKS